MKSLAEVYNNGLALKPQSVDHKTHVINEIEKQFNQIFIDLKSVFPAITTVIKTQADLNTFKKQWLLAFAENGITTLNQLESGMRIARQQNNPFVPSPGQFITWCREGTAQVLGVPTAEQVMHEFHRYSAKRLDYSCAELFPWSHPIMYWIITDLRKHMHQYNQSELEVSKRAEYLLGKWAKKLSKGETVPEIRVQIEHKPEPVVTDEYYESDAVKAMWKRIREKRSQANG